MRRKLVLCVILLTMLLPSCGAPQRDSGIPTNEAEAEKPEQPPVAVAPTPAPIAGSEPGVGLGRGLRNVADITVTQAYVIDSKKWGKIAWTLEIPMKSYAYYRERPRPERFADYVDMAADPYDDEIVDAVVKNIQRTAAEKGLSRLDQLSLVLDFVQSLTYAEDIVTIYQAEYPRYPVETLLEKRGDCEDTSILAAAILTEMDFDAALLLFEKFDHMGAGVNYYAIEYGNSWIYEGRRYWYFDTTGGRSVGWSPDEYGKTAAYVMVVRD